MAPSSCGAYIARLPEEVRAMVDSLPAEEQEVFTHLASYSILAKAPRKQAKNKSSRGGSKGKSGEAHDRCVGCDCLDCYIKFWGMWDSSPNKSVIDKALEALELKEESGRRSSWSMGKQRKGKEKVSRSAAAAPSHRGDSGGKERKESPSSAGNLDESSKTVDEEACSVSVDEPVRRLAEKVKGESLSRPPKSKQVAPVDFKAEEDEDELVKPTTTTTSTSAPGEESSSPRSGWKSASEAAGFVCDKLLWMWNPRFRRRQ